MRRPPPLTDFVKYPIVGGTIALAIGVTIASLSKRIDITPLCETIDIRRGQLWRLLTSTLPHANFIHLAVDIMFTWMFGTPVEEVFGHFKTLAIFVLLAVASMGAEYAFLDGGEGLSGIGYGLFGLLWVLSRRDRRFEDALDQRTTNFLVGWFFICIALTVTKILPVANIAHGAGAVAGVLLGWAIVSFGTVRAKSSRDGAVQLGWKPAGSWRDRILSLAALILLIGGVLVGDTIGRPWINFSQDRGVAEAFLAYTALTQNRYEEALRWSRDAVRMQPRTALYWYNMGFAYNQLNRHSEAVAAFKRAYELEPSNPEYRAAARDSN